MWVRKEYSPYALFIGVVIISNSISGGETGLKKNELAKFNLGKYSVNCLGGFDILEAKLYLMDEIYLFIMSGKSEELWYLMALIICKHSCDVLCLNSGTPTNFSLYE